MITFIVFILEAYAGFIDFPALGAIGEIHILFFGLVAWYVAYVFLTPVHPESLPAEDIV